MKNEIDEGYVVSKELAKKLIHQWLYRQYPYSSLKAQEELKNNDIFLSDCNGGWNFVNPEDPDAVDGMFGYNGIIIFTLDGYLKEYLNKDEKIDEWTADCLNEDGIVIYPWDNEKGYEIFVFHEGD